MNNRHDITIILTLLYIYYIYYIIIIIIIIIKVSNEHLSLCRIYNIERPTISNLSAICSTLGGIKCLIVEGGRADLYGRVRLNVNEEDIIMALKNDPVVGKMIR